MLCSRVQNLLSAYVDRELTGAEMQAVRRHLDGCGGCQNELAGIRSVKGLFGALPAAEPPAPFDPSILDGASRLGAGLRLPVFASLAFVPCCAFMQGADWLLGAFRSTVRSTTRLACAGALSVIVLAAAVLQHPQQADAVTANVPELVPEEIACPHVGCAHGAPLPGAYPALVSVPELPIAQTSRPILYRSSGAPALTLLRYSPADPGWR
jgi:anti-sigma factor RsiW